MILADKITALRKKAGWSQEELAEQLGVTRQSVSKWEGAQSVPDMDKVVQMSRLFGVTTDFLLKDELSEEEPAPAGCDSPLRRVTMAEASEYLALRRAAAPKIAFATMLCILSPVPIFIGMAEGSDLAMILAVCGMLFLAGVGAAVFVVTGVRWAGMQKILQSGDYAPAEKKRNQKEKALSAAYWTLAVAVYLGWNFTTEDWKNTWIVWPVAGVLYAAVLHLYRLFTKSRED